MRYQVPDRGQTFCEGQRLKIIRAGGLIVDAISDSNGNLEFVQSWREHMPHGNVLIIEAVKVGSRESHRLID
jgi:hypothetical protein